VFFIKKLSNPALLSLGVFGMSFMQSVCAFEVEGRFGSNDSYTMNNLIDFYLEGGESISNGTDRVSVTDYNYAVGEAQASGETNNIFLYFSQPLDIIDTIYGPQDKKRLSAKTPQITESSNDLSNKFHTLYHIESSNNLPLSFFIDEGQKENLFFINIDYLENNSVAENSLVTTEENTTKPDNFASLLSISTSLDYNLYQSTSAKNATGIAITKVSVGSLW
jgi:hypothetical protein